MKKIIFVLLVIILTLSACDNMPESGSSSANGAESITNKYQSSGITIQSALYDSNSHVLNETETNYVLSVLNGHENWSDRELKIIYDYIFVLSNETQLSYCSSHGVFRDKSARLEVTISENEREKINAFLPQ